MGDAAGQLANGFHFLGLEERKLGLSPYLDLGDHPGLQTVVELAQLVFNLHAFADLTFQILLSAYALFDVEHQDVDGVDRAVFVASGTRCGGWLWTSKILRKLVAELQACGPATACS